MALADNSGIAPWDSEEWPLSPQSTQAQHPSSETAPERSQNRPLWAARFKVFYGIDLNNNPNFKNAIDGKRLNDNALYFQVSPYGFARRSMMRTATVRALLLDRKLPRIIGPDDQLMVIVSMEWLFASQDIDYLESLGFNPEDYIDVER